MFESEILIAYKTGGVKMGLSVEFGLLSLRVKGSLVD